MARDTDEPPTEPYRTEDTAHDAPDGTTLAVRLFLPEGADSDDPVPVLLQRTPYGRPDDVAERSFAPMALDDGYAVAYEDTRGRGDSDGEFLPWVHEAADGAATIEWLADRPWSTGRVGTFGGSSPGHIQLFAAAERPSGLAAIAPMFAPSDLHRCDFFQDGAMSAMTHVTWALGDSVAGHTVDRLERSGDLASATADAAREALDDALERVPELAAHRPLVDLPEDVLAGVDLPAGIEPGDLVPHWDAWTSRPTYDEFWRSFDAELLYDRIDVPGLHLTGWYELCQHGTLANFAGLRDRSPAPQHLVVGPWAHQDTSSEIGAVDFGPAASADAYGIWRTHLEFFDAYVHGEPSGRFPADGDRLVETFRATVADGGGGEWTRHDDWPPADAVTERWYLHSDGDAATDLEDGVLTRTKPEKFEPADSWTHDPTDPVPTRGGPLCCGETIREPGPHDQRAVERRDDVCTYTTEPLSRPLELAGPVSATLTATTTAEDTDVTAKLVHVTDAGPAYNLCEGIRRARYRRGRDREIAVRPGEPIRIVVDMWDVHHVVPAGDRLRLEVASSNHPRFDPHPGTADPWRATAGEVRSADQTLYHELDRESVLEITRRPRSAPRRPA